MRDPHKCDLTKSFELPGEWWREGADPGKPISGWLSYTPDHGLQLQVYGDFPGGVLATLASAGPGRPIWGEVPGFDGKPVNVSLLDVIRTNRPNDPRAEDPPLSHTIYFINHAILGAHVADPNSLNVASIHMSLSDFESFANTKSVVLQWENDAVTISYTRAKRAEETLREPNMRVLIETVVGASTSLFGRNGTITYHDDLKLSPAYPLPFDASMEIVDSLTNFFLLCARESVELRYIRGVLDSGGIISCFGSVKGRKARITPKDWVLTLRDVGGRLQDVLNRWFPLVKKLRFVGPVFFSELANPSPVQDARFFHFAGCLEAFHREVVQADAGKFMPKKEYKAVTRPLLDQLPPTLPAGLRDAINSGLSRANDHVFAERINALFNALEPETQRHLADEPQRFLEAIKHSRNKLAHVTDEPKGETFEGVEFAHANLSIRAWLTILMLKECGISESLIRERMAATDYLYWGPFTFAKRNT